MRMELVARLLGLGAQVHAYTAWLTFRLDCTFDLTLCSFT